MAAPQIPHQRKFEIIIREALTGQQVVEFALMGAQSLLRLRRDVPPTGLGQAAVADPDIAATGDPDAGLFQGSEKVFPAT